MRMQSHWQQLAGGAALLHGYESNDKRGYSREILDSTLRAECVDDFIPRQENLVATHFAGCGRGMHYQVSPLSQAKMVTVLRGRAQFFWISLHDARAVPHIHSITLAPSAVSLYTPTDCLHGFLAIEDGTEFLLKMSAPISLAHRGEVNFMSKSLKFNFGCPLREDLLSPRDLDAPEWEMRRRSTTD